MDNKQKRNDVDDPEEKMEGQTDNRNRKTRIGITMAEKYIGTFIVIILLVVAILLVLLLKPKVPNLNYNRLNGKKICTTETCVREAFRLLNDVDFTLDACEDFSELVCRRYQDNKLSSKPIYVQNADEQLLSTIKEILDDVEEEVNEFESVAKAKKFYNSCLRGGSREQTTGNIVRELLRKAKMTKNSVPSKNVYSRERTLALLIIHGNKNPFFKFRRTPHFIYLYPGGPVLKSEVLLGNSSADIVTRMKYKKLILNALIKMDIPVESASKDAEEMVKFEESFAKLAVKAKCTGNFSEIALRELEDMFPELKWSVIIQYIYGHYGLENDFSKKLTILVACEDYFRKIIFFMSDYDFRILEEFIMWSFALHYLPVLDHTFRPFFREIEQVVETQWQGNAYDADWKICTYATMYYFNSPIGHLYFKQEHLEQTDEEIKDMFQDIQGAYEEVVCTQRWMSERTISQCKTMVMETNLVIGLPTNVIDKQIVDAMYSLVNVTDDIIENLLSLDKAIYVENIIGTQLTPLYSKPMDSAVYYEHGTLTILFGATLPPVFATGAPRYLNYGWLGFIIAREMWSAVQSLVFPDRTPLPNEARMLHWMQVCLTKQDSECQILIKETTNGINTLMADQTGLIVATEAYMNYQNRVGEEHSIPGLNTSNEKLFFMNFGQLMCKASRGNPLARGGMSSTSFNACRLNNIIGNTPKFSETFGCSEDSAMNNDTHCKLWI